MWAWQLRHLHFNNNGNYISSWLRRDLMFNSSPGNFTCVEKRAQKGLWSSYNESKLCFVTWCCFFLFRCSQQFSERGWLKYRILIKVNSWSVRITNWTVDFIDKSFFCNKFSNLNCVFFSWVSLNTSLSSCIFLQLLFQYLYTPLSTLKYNSCNWFRRVRGSVFFFDI